MTNTLSMIVPSSSVASLFVCRSGSTYTADQYGIITGVAYDDVTDLMNYGARVLEVSQTGRNNLSAVTAPGATDDSSKDYAVGSMWIDTVGNAAYFCTDATASAAVWTIAVTGVGGVQAKRCTAQTDKTTSTALGNITGLSVPVVAGGVYTFRAHLTTSSTANGGIKVAVANSGTTTSFTATAQNINGTTANATTTTTTAGSAIGGATAVTTDVFIAGSIVVNAAGNLTVQFAQNASHSDTSSVLVGSDFVVTRIA